MDREPERDFFISYTAVDDAWARWIAVELERAGYTTVVQAFDFRPGADFMHQMQQATESAGRTIAVLSSAYFGSRFAESEWRVAFARDPSGELGGTEAAADCGRTGRSATDQRSVPRRPSRRKFA